MKVYCHCDYHAYWHRFFDMFRGHIWKVVSNKDDSLKYCKRCLKIIWKRKTK